MLSRKTSTNLNLEVIKDLELKRATAKTYFAIGLLVLSLFAAFAILIVIATCCYGLSVNVIKTFLADQDALLISAISLLIVGIPYGIFLSTTDFTVRLFEVPEAKMAFLSLATLSIFGTTFSNILYFNLVKTAGPLFASAVTYLMPIIALSWGIADGEVLNPLHIVALLAILAGVALISWKGEMKLSRIWSRKS